MITYNGYGSFREYASMDEKEAQDIYMKAYNDVINDVIVKGYNAFITDANSFYLTVQEYFNEMVEEILSERAIIYRHDYEDGSIDGNKNFDNSFMKLY